MKKIIELQNISTQFGHQTIHKNLNMDVFEGEILGIIGGSGSGKSVLLKLMVGLLPIQKGIVKVYGQNIEHLTEKEKYELETNRGILFQDGALFNALTVMENIKAPMEEYTKLSENIMDDLAILKQTMVGLANDVQHKFPAQLSGGMRKRAALARALALDPKLLFLDEPTAGLDPINAKAFDKLILDLKTNLNLTVVMVTHDIETLKKICDRIAVIIDHKLITGTRDEIINNNHPWIQKYFEDRQDIQR